MPTSKLNSSVCRNGGKRPKKSTKGANLSAVALQRAAAHQIRGVEAHRRPPLRLGVLLHCTHRQHTEQSVSNNSFPNPQASKPSRGSRERASPSVSRSVWRRWRSRSRRELTEAVAAACFSLSSATDAIRWPAGRAACLKVRAPVGGLSTWLWAWRGRSDGLAELGVWRGLGRRRRRQERRSGRRRRTDRGGWVGVWVGLLGTRWV